MPPEAIDHHIQKITDRCAGVDSPAASVIVLTFNFDAKKLRNNLLAVLKETGNFEVILVDNNDQRDIAPEVLDLPIRYIKTTHNLGAGLGRNIGASHARGSILIFMDDDSTPLDNFVANHLKIYRDPGIFGARGKGIPRHITILNRFATHYDLGCSQKPSTINVEFNCSFRKNIFQEAGGFSDLPVCHEGIDLCCRIIRRYHCFDHLVYDPGPAVYHNYAETFSELVKKRVYTELNYRRLYTLYPDCIEYIERFKFNPNPYECPLTPWELFQLKWIDRLANDCAIRNLKKAAS